MSSGSAFKKLALTAATAIMAASGAVLLAPSAAHADTVVGTYKISPLSDLFRNVEVQGESTDTLAHVQQYRANGHDNQKWRFVQVGPGLTFELVNVNSGKCLWTDGVRGDQLMQAPCTGSPWVLWQTPIPTGAVPQAFLNPASNLVMDVDQSSLANGARIIGWPYNGGNNQLFDTFS
jgi:hypothetical protein